MKSGTISSACLVVSVLAFAGCDRENRPFSRVQLINPSPVLAGAITPQRLVLTPLIGGSCPFLTPFTTVFDVTIDHRGSEDLFLDQVTIQLLDGSSVGGSPVLMSSADLAARFGSTRIRRGVTSRFGFTPLFGCDRFRPHSLATEVLLRDASGLRQTLHLVVPVG